MSRIHPVLLFTVAGIVASPTEILHAQKNRLADASAPAPRYVAPSAVRYGDAVKLGNGHARTYVIADKAGAPRELGVAFDEAALEGLPAAGSGHHDGHMMTHE